MHISLYWLCYTDIHTRVNETDGYCCWVYEWKCSFICLMLKIFSCIFPWKLFIAGEIFSHYVLNPNNEQPFIFFWQMFWSFPFQYIFFCEHKLFFNEYLEKISRMNFAYKMTNCLLNLRELNFKGRINFFRKLLNLSAWKLQHLKTQERFSKKKNH